MTLPFRSASCVCFTLGSYEDHIRGHVLLDDQCEAALVPLHTGTHDALYLGKRNDENRMRKSLLLSRVALSIRAVSYIIVASSISRQINFVLFVNIVWVLLSKLKSTVLEETQRYK